MKLNEISTHPKIKEVADCINMWSSQADHVPQRALRIESGLVNSDYPIRMWNKEESMRSPASAPLDIPLIIDGKLAIQFGNVKESFQVTGFKKLTSLEGMPKRIFPGNVEPFCTFSHCGITSLKELDGMPLVTLFVENCALTELDCHLPELTHLTAQHNVITSLVGIEDKFPKLEQLTMSLSKVKEGGLGLLQLENFMGEFGLHNERMNNQLPAPFEIIKRHLRKRDIFACQQELIEAGFEEYTKL